MRMTIMLAMLIAASWALTGAVMVAVPLSFYQLTPTISMMGPFNAHFIRDAGFAYLASGGIAATGWSAARRDLAIAGAVWPALHAAFHLWLWAGRGLAPDVMIGFDLVAVIGPAAIMLWLTIVAQHRALAADSR